MKEKQKFPVLWVSSIVLIFYAGVFSEVSFPIGYLMFAIGGIMNIHHLNKILKENKK